MKKIEKHYNQIINWAENKGFKDIKANVDGFETPFGFSQKEGKEVLTPDVTAMSYQSKYYFEIAIKPTDIHKTQQLISRWKVLSFAAKHKGGKLYLFAPRGNKSFTQKTIDQYGLNATFMSLTQLSAPHIS